MNKIKGIIIGIVVLAIILVVGVIAWYNISLGAVSSSDEEVEITVPIGTYGVNISKILKENGLIKDETAFKLYIKLNNITDFQAGTYKLSKNMDVKQIINILQNGVMYADSVKITFLEGKTIRWYAKTIAENTNFTEDDVYNKLEDTVYLNTLIEKYWFITDEIKNEDIYYSLEGYLWPDTYYFEKDNLTLEKIFEKLLDQTGEKLEKYKAKIQSGTVSAHQYLTLASIVEMEGINSESRKDIASVFYNRLESGMPLGSDVTTYYGAKIEVGERDLYAKELNASNGYNTRGKNMNGKIPVGPISSVSESSIDAVLNPSQTDYLFFVADKNGKVYFTKTNEEHEAKIKELKANGMWFEF